MARVFSAVDIEDEKVLENIKQVRDRMDLGFSTVSREKMHLTLQFFEDIDKKQIKKVERTLENIEIQPFNMDITGVGAFPSEDYIRVVWAGVSSHKIFKLQKQAEVHDVPSDDHNQFKPHITFMRVRDISKKKKKKLKRMVKEHKKEEFGKVKVDSVKLFESELTPEGSRYKLLSEKEL